MKKKILILCSVLLIISFSGCGMFGGNDAMTEEQTVTEENTVTETETMVEDETEKSSSYNVSSVEEETKKLEEKAKEQMDLFDKTDKKNTDKLQEIYNALRTIDNKVEKYEEEIDNLNDNSYDKHEQKLENLSDEIDEYLDRMETLLGYED